MFYICMHILCMYVISPSQKIQVHANMHADSKLESAIYYFAHFTTHSPTKHKHATIKTAAAVGPAGAKMSHRSF